ncbi:MAG: exodeoxyribonuclease VII large subunit [Kiritimatiellae bacterium]|nr:exodeoxyribonuclease VII large subunit [Kiritimatiellia bacterium]
MPGKTQESPYTVSSLTMELKSVIERGYTRIYVEGEISGWRPYPSGHVYFTLKDGGAQIQAVMFKSNFERCRARASLRDGAKVLVYANATIYPQRGNYQLVVLAAKPVGEGDLMQRYLMLKAKLEAEGLFSQERKRPLPFMPRRIAIVTSPAGAVVHDMCRVLMRRFPALEIRIFPAQVQGADAPRSVIAGLEYFNGLKPGDGEFVPDVIIVARGGGSFEDLFCFSDEALVRAVAASRVPVISAVGHETDFTLCDFAADVRAGTPSIAAEIAVPEMSELRRRLDRLLAAVASAVRGKYEWLAQRLDHLHDGLSAALRESLSDAGSTLRLLSEKLALLSPYAVLERGYSLTTDASGRVVKCAADAPVGAKVTTRLASGVLESVVSSSISQDAPPGGADKNAKEGRDG